MRVLVVDDEASLRQIMAKALERAGYQVETAENGRVALEMFRRHPADLVVTDLIMPEKEGIETIMELRLLNRSVRIIAISGGGRSTPETYLALAQNLGAATTLAKPFGIPELLAAVADVCGQAPASGSQPATA